MAELNPKDYELYGYMSMQAYQDNGGVPPAGWQVLADSTSMGIGKDTGYYGVAYQNIEHPDQVVVAHRGTEFGKDTIKDGLADAQIGLHEVPSQFSDAMKFVEGIGKEADVSVGSIAQTGHSLGGALAEMGGIVTDAPVYAVDPPGIKGLLPDLESSRGVEAGTYQNKDLDNLTIYSVQGDLVSGSIGDHPVPVTPIENPHFPGQVEAREQMHDIASKLVENMPHDDLRPAQDLPDVLSGTKGLMDGVDNHSSAFAHALGQDMTAQDRMGPIYGPPTTEQPAADHIPSKAEWAVGDGFHSLESQLNPPPAEAAQPATPATPDISTPVVPDASAPAAPDASLQTQTPDAFAAAAAPPATPDAFAGAAATPDATTQAPLPDAFAATAATPATPDVTAQVHDAFAGSTAAAPDTTAQAPLPDAFAAAQSTPVADASTQTPAVVDVAQSVTQAPLPDAFAATAPTDAAPQAPALPDAFTGATATPATPDVAAQVHDAFAVAQASPPATDAIAQAPLPDAFAASQSVPTIDTAQPTTQTPLPDAFAGVGAPTDTVAQAPLPDAFAVSATPPATPDAFAANAAAATPDVAQAVHDAFAAAGQTPPVPDTALQPALPDAFAAAQSTPVVDAAQPITQAPLPDAFAATAPTDTVSQIPALPDAFAGATPPATPDAFAATAAQPDFTAQAPVTDAFAPPPATQPLPDAFAGVQNIDTQPPAHTVLDTIVQATPIPDTSTTPLPDAFAAATPSEPISQSPLPDAFSSLQQNAPATADPVEQSHIPNAFTQDTTPATPDAFAPSVVQNPPPDAFAPHDQSIVLPDAFAAAASAEHSTPSVPVNDIFAGASDVSPPPAHDTYVPPADTYVPPAQEPSWQAPPPAAEPAHEQQSWVGSLFGGGGSQDHDSGRSSWVDHVTPDTTSHETHAAPDTSHQTSWSDHVSHDTGSSVSHDSGSSHSHDSSGGQSHDSGSSHDSGHGGHDSSGAGMGM